MGLLDFVKGIFGIGKRKIVFTGDPTQEVDFSLDEDKEQWFRKLVSSTRYCSNKTEKWRATTWEDNDNDRELELLDAINNEVSDHCSPDNMGETGYASDEVSEDEVNESYTWSSILVERIG